MLGSRVLGVGPLLCTWWLYILLTLNNTWPSGHGLLRVWVRCLLSVVAYMGKREKALTPKVYVCSYVKILGVIWVRLHMNFVSFMRSFFIFVISWSEKGLCRMHILFQGGWQCSNLNFVVIERHVKVVFWCFTILF